MRVNEDLDILESGGDRNLSRLLKKMEGVEIETSGRENTDEGVFSKLSGGWSNW